MIFTVQNTDTTILENLIASLAQIKVSGQANASIQIDTVNVGTTPDEGFETLTDAQFEAMDLSFFENLTSSPTVNYTVNFYVDSARTSLLFSDTSTASPQNFTVVSGRVFYTPVDTGLNDGTSVSTTKGQSTYYLTVTSTAGLNADLVYNNSRNLMFQSVLVASTTKPAFTRNENQAFIVPADESQKNFKVSGLHGIIIASFDIFLQLTVFNWANLSEQARLQQLQLVGNLVRNALYADRYRNNTCTLYDEQLNGTLVKNIKPLASDAVMKGIVRVDCVYRTDDDSTF